MTSDSSKVSPQSSRFTKAPVSGSVKAQEAVSYTHLPLGDDYRAILKDGFDHRWIDVYQNEGKRSGAYSAGTVVHPYAVSYTHLPERRLPGDDR